MRILYACLLYVLLTSGCESTSVGVGIRDLDGDHITECTISRHVASNKECMFEITVKKDL